MRINLLLIATNKYIQFLPALIQSLEENFLKDCDVIYNIFTDDEKEVQFMFAGTFASKSIVTHKIDHYEWPYVTLYRYHFFAIHFNKMVKSDYYFYLDVDTLIKAPITKEEILGDRVGTTHCGYVGARGTYETNPQSTSWVPPHQGTTYFGGGFWGFNYPEFVNFINAATEMINADIENKIIPVWHDESVLNRYLIDNPPTKILSPSFHYPEGNIEKYKAKWPEQYECKILLLDKNHKELRTS